MSRMYKISKSWKLFKSENYSSVKTIRGRKLFAELQYLYQRNDITSRWQNFSDDQRRQPIQSAHWLSVPRFMSNRPFLFARSPFEPTKKWQKIDRRGSVCLPPQGLIRLTHPLIWAFWGLCVRCSNGPFLFATGYD